MVIHAAGLPIEDAAVELEQRGGIGRALVPAADEPGRDGEPLADEIVRDRDELVLGVGSRSDPTSRPAGRRPCAPHGAKPPGPNTATPASERRPPGLPSVLTPSSRSVRADSGPDPSCP